MPSERQQQHMAAHAAWLQAPLHISNSSHTFIYHESPVQARPGERQQQHFTMHSAWLQAPCTFLTVLTLSSITNHLVQARPSERQQQHLTTHAALLQAPCTFLTALTLPSIMNHLIQARPGERQQQHLAMHVAWQQAHMHVLCGPRHDGHALVGGATASTDTVTATINAIRTGIYATTINAGCTAKMLPWAGRSTAPPVPRSPRAR